MLKTIYLTLLLIGLTIFASECSGQSTEIPGTIGNKMYKIVYTNNYPGWTGAHHGCKISNSELASIESLEENLFLNDYFQKEYGNETGPFLWTSGSSLGAKDPHEPPSLKWSSTGVPVLSTYVNWGGRSEPGQMTNPTFSFQCIAGSWKYNPFGANPIPPYHFSWNMKDCTVSYGALCQSFVDSN